jgi:DNA polymerase-3 subunit delta'
VSWESIIGQGRVKALLQRILESGHIAHAYLFYGPEGVGKDALAIEFAKTLNCSVGTNAACGTCPSCQQIANLQHPDLRLVFPLPAGKGEKTGDQPLEVLTENQVAEIREQIRLKAADPYYHIEIPKANTIKINSIRDIKRESSMSRVQEGWKIFLILDADAMNPEAGNSLLKILEEPLPGIMLLLTSSSKDRLLPTIISRCQLIRCDTLSDDEIEEALRARDGADPSLAHLAAQLAGGSYGAGRRLLSQNIQEERAEVVTFMRLVLGGQKTPLMDFINELSSSDRTAVERWLKLLGSWIRDAFLLSKHVQVMVFEEDKKHLTSFVEKYGGADFPAALRTVERAIAHLDKNVYLYLVLMNLALQLRKDMEQQAFS